MRDLTACGPQFLHQRASLAFGGSNWLDRVSAGLATLRAQQSCLSPSLSCCSARQECSQLNCCHVPFKAHKRSWGWQQLLSQGSRRNSGPLVISGNQYAGTNLSLRQLGDHYHTLCLHSSVHPFDHPCQDSFCICNLLGSHARLRKVHSHMAGEKGLLSLFLLNF